MAKHYSNIIAKKNGSGGANISNNIIPGDDIAGLVLYATAIYTLAGTEAAADTIELVDIPADAVIVPQLSHVTASTDPGSALVLDIGDKDDADRYADGITLSTGGQVAFTSGTMPVAATAPFRDSASPIRVIAEVKTATSLTADVVLSVTIAYRCKG